MEVSETIGRVLITFWERYWENVIIPGEFQAINVVIALKGRKNKRKKSRQYFTWSAYPGKDACASNCGSQYTIDFLSNCKPKFARRQGLAGKQKSFVRNRWRLLWCLRIHFRCLVAGSHTVEPQYQFSNQSPRLTDVARLWRCLQHKLKMLSYHDKKSFTWSFLTTCIYNARIYKPKPFAFIDSWSVDGHNFVSIRSVRRLIKDKILLFIEGKMFVTWNPRGCVGIFVRNMKPFTYIKFIHLVIGEAVQRRICISILAVF